MVKAKLVGLMAALVGLLALSGPVAAQGACDATVSSGDSIQAAVDSAASGDTVCVEDGTYTEQVVINKDLTLLGQDNPVIEAPGSPGQFTIAESGSTWEPVVFAYGGTDDGSGNISDGGTVQVRITGFTIDGNDREPSGRSAGILLRNVSDNSSVAHNTVQNMLVNGRETFGIIVYGDSDVTIAENDISGYGRGGIGANGDGGTLPDPTVSIKGNSVTGPGRHEDVTWAPNGIQIGFGAEGVITGNAVMGNGWPGARWAGTAILVFESDNVQIMGNHVKDNEAAIGASAWGWFHPTASNTKITDNTIENADFGIVVRAAVLGFGITGMDPSANNNKIVGNNLDGGGGVTGIFVGVGFFFGGDDTSFTPTADNNKIIRNGVVGFDTAIVEGGTNSKQAANEVPAP